MEPRIVVSLKFADKCKLISLDGDSSFLWFVSQVRETWAELNSTPASFVFSVGGYKNTCLNSEDDFINMIFLCRHLNLSLVDVSVSCCKNNGKSAKKSKHDSNEIGNACDSNYSGKDYGKGSCFSKAKGKGNGPNCDFDDNGLGCDFNYNGKVIDLNDQYASIPVYDICPRSLKTPMLSDSWSYLMKNGVGAVFTGGVVQFRTELIKYSTILGFNFNFIRNSRRYVHVVCKEQQSAECNWFVKAKAKPVSNHFIVYKANLTHSCIGKLVKDEAARLCPKIMAEFFLPNVRKRPEIGGKEIVDLMQIQYGVDISYSKAWRTIETARNTIFGSYADSYSQLRCYCKAIGHTNPGSIVKLEYDTETHHFERLFISFKACSDGFQFCRPMIFIDGTFMKGRARGTLLVATAKDGDNGLFPLAFAVVSSENTDNWVWFLENIRDGVKHKSQIFYLSDRNCGLMSAFNIVFKEPVHFFCMYHLLQNLKGRFSNGWSNLKRATMGEHFRDCAYAPNLRLFDEKLALFKEVGGSIAEQWLEDLPFEKWAVAHSPNIVRYGEMTSNAAESFNSWIKDFRSKPVTQMIDDIRVGISRWFVERRKESQSWTGALVPQKEGLWHHLTDISRSWFVAECPGGNYEVSSSPSVSVNLDKKTCTCSQWQILGFPCAHAVAVIRRHRSSVFSHVDECFFTSNYQKCYEKDLNPIPQTELYDCADEEYITILPPLLNRHPGRPKKSRNPSYGEWRKRRPNFCTRCKTFAKHDSLTCGKILDHHYPKK